MAYNDEYFKDSDDIDIIERYDLGSPSLSDPTFAHDDESPRHRRKEHDDLYFGGNPEDVEEGSDYVDTSNH